MKFGFRTDRTSVSFCSTCVFSPSVQIDVKYNGKVIYFKINKWSPFLYYDFYTFPIHSFPYIKTGNAIALLDQHNVTMHQHGKKPIKILLYQKKASGLLPLPPVFDW